MPACKARARGVWVEGVPTPPGEGGMVVLLVVRAGAGVVGAKLRQVTPRELF